MDSTFSIVAGFRFASTLRGGIFVTGLWIFFRVLSSDFKMKTFLKENRYTFPLKTHSSCQGLEKLLIFF